MEQESWKMDKDETGRLPPQGPILCTNNCGFFGSATTMNLCSQCYRNFVMMQAKAAEAACAMSATQSQLEAPPSDESAKSASASASASAAAEMNQAPQQPIRCFTCKKRIGLTGFKCRCGNQFCAVHRYHDKHNCSFDYRAAARDAIAKANPVVKADKLDKI